MKSFKEFLTESQRSDIENLKPDSRITVYHGSDIATITDFARFGIDAKKPKRMRLYPHWIAGKQPTRGIFVSPDLETAMAFGKSVVKFTVLGKDLYPAFSHRHDKYFAKKFPNSFRPGVSDDMLNRGKGKESQALFIGLVSPRQIEKVYDVHFDKDGTYHEGLMGQYRSAFDREEFLKWVQDVYLKKQHDNLYKSQFEFTDRFVEPQEINITVDEFIARVKKKYPYITDDTIEDALKRAAQDNSFEGLGRIPYSVGKMLLKKIKARYGSK